MSTNADAAPDVYMNEEEDPLDKEFQALMERTSDISRTMSHIDLQHDWQTLLGKYAALMDQFDRMDQGVMQQQAMLERWVVHPKKINTNDAEILPTILSVYTSDRMDKPKQMEQQQENVALGEGVERLSQRDIAHSAIAHNDHCNALSRFLAKTVREQEMVTPNMERLEQRQIKQQMKQQQQQGRKKGTMTPVPTSSDMKKSSKMREHKKELLLKPRMSVDNERKQMLGSLFVGDVAQSKQGLYIVRQLAKNQQGTIRQQQQRQQQQQQQQQQQHQKVAPQTVAKSNAPADQRQQQQQQRVTVHPQPSIPPTQVQQQQQLQQLQRKQQQQQQQRMTNQNMDRAKRMQLFSMSEDDFRQKILAKSPNTAPEEIERYMQRFRVQKEQLQREEQLQRQDQQR